MMSATTFSRQNDAGSRASTTKYCENLVLVVVLVLESKDLYYSADEKMTRKKEGTPISPHFLRLLFDSLPTIWTPRFTIQTPGRG